MGPNEAVVGHNAVNDVDCSQGTADEVDEGRMISISEEWFPLRTFPVYHRVQLEDHVLDIGHEFPDQLVDLLVDFHDTSSHHLRGFAFYLARSLFSVHDEGVVKIVLQHCDDLLDLVIDEGEGDQYLFDPAGLR